MTSHGSRSALARRRPGPTDLLETEIAQERAVALGRLGRALEAALRGLAEFDAKTPAQAPADEVRRHRAALVSDAAAVLWQFVVQREACGLRDSRQIMRDYRVPAEIQARMGAFPGNPRTSWRDR